MTNSIAVESTAVPALKETVVLETKPSAAVATDRTVVMGLDCSPHSKATVAWSLGHFLTKRDRVVVVHVIAPPLTSTEPDIAANMRELNAIALAQTTRTLTKLTAPIAESNITLTVVVIEGAPRDGLLAACKSYEADALLVGSRGEGSVLTRALVGSVAHSLMNDAPLPVVVVRGAAGMEATRETLQDGDADLASFDDVV
ncbi:hypothetical protein H9P43_003295 [Blastocladiella emersonii ATCC 22665]|nr:hypothetical protein H9P43_003295 [Blastocladiella emersonii ATCC 22665]